MPTATSDNALVTTSPTVTTSSVVVLAANPKRLGFTVYNNSANSAYCTFGATSSAASPTFIIATFANKDFWGPVVYKGQISAIRNAGTGTMIFTEIQED